MYFVFGPFDTLNNIIYKTHTAKGYRFCVRKYEGALYTYNVYHFIMLFSKQCKRIGKYLAPEYQSTFSGQQDWTKFYYIEPSFFFYIQKGSPQFQAIDQIVLHINKC